MGESEKYKSHLSINNQHFSFYDLKKLEQRKVSSLPYSIRILLECAVRNCDEFQIKSEDIENILNWTKTSKESVEIPFKPARVLLQDFTGVPAIVDFAAMRDCISSLGGDPKSINPVCPADLVIDHSVQVDVARSGEALVLNQDIEFDRNEERFGFLKWGAENFNNMLIVPPGSGIVHQVNLECLARVVFGAEEDGGTLYPDSVVGTDSHTTMINGLGILGWGVGGIEAEAVMLDQPVNLVLPPVTGFRLTGKLNTSVTSTDMVLTITSMLRKIGVVGHFVEFFGKGVSGLSIADRATVSNMCPEYGATCGYFPVDERSLEYLSQTGRNEKDIKIIKEYLIANLLFYKISETSNEESVPQYSQIFELDLGTIEPCVAGPKRPHDHVPISKLKKDFDDGLIGPLGFKGFNVPTKDVNATVSFKFKDEFKKENEGCLRHGDVVIAAITSCTNTSNPSVMLAAGLLAKNAVERGLTVKKQIKTSLSPGSGVVTKYLERSGFSKYLDILGFNLTGYGCMTCIGNSGPLEENISKAIDDGNLVVASVLSGNRNFEGRVHPQTRANYLSSPPLVIAYALSGTVRIDFEKDPIGHDLQGNPVFLREIWPTNDKVREIEIKCVLPEMFKEVYNKIKEGGSEKWKNLKVPKVNCYPWNDKSTYIRKPPFFDGLTKELPKLKAVKNARVLLNLGDSITTDHISPAGSIARNSPAARYLSHLNVRGKDFNTYGARRGNDEVMSRGTFANIRLFNKLINKASPRTLHFPSGDEMDVFDCAQRYQKEEVSVIILAGKEYGSGSSRDWAAKGPYLLGVKAVIAESFERIHRSNLIGMGIIPLQFFPVGTNADTLGLTGKELFTIALPELFEEIKPGQMLKVFSNCGKSFEVLSRFDTEVELEYFRNGGILQFMIRKLLLAKE